MRLPLHHLRLAIAVRFETQTDAARAAGIREDRLSRICRGADEPTVIERDRLSEVLNADPSWLFSPRVNIPVFKPGETVEATLAGAGR